MASFPEIRVVLFDFDGTLARLTLDFGRMRALVLDELVKLLGAGAPVLKRSDLPVMELVHEACKGQPEELAAQIAERAELAVSNYEVEAAENSHLFDYTLPLLDELKKRNIASAIVTRNCRAAVEKVFPEHSGYCAALVSRNDVPPEALKPDPAHLRAALAMLGCGPEKTLMVGDHPMDIVAGKAAGCFTGGVLCGNSSREVMQASGPDWLAVDTAALFEELGIFKQL